ASALARTECQQYACFRIVRPLEPVLPLRRQVRAHNTPPAGSSVWVGESETSTIRLFRIASHVPTRRMKGTPAPKSFREPSPTAPSTIQQIKHEGCCSQIHTLQGQQLRGHWKHWSALYSWWQEQAFFARTGGVATLVLARTLVRSLHVTGSERESCPRRTVKK